MKQKRYYWGIILLLMLIINNNVYSQNQSRLLSFKINGTIKEVFHEIEKKSNYVFFYYDNVIDVNRKVNVDVKDKTIQEVLEEVLKDTDNSFYIKERQIFITKKDSRRGVNVKNAENKRRFKGKVLDDLGEPLSGATVQVLGSTRGVITDIDGSFEIEVSQGDKLKMKCKSYLLNRLKISETLLVLMIVYASAITTLFLFESKEKQELKRTIQYDTSYKEVCRIIDENEKQDE